MPENEKQRIKDVLTWLKNEEEFEVFVEPVDFRLFDNYLLVVAYPTCINLVLERLVNNWYRRTKVTVFHKVQNVFQKYMSNLTI